MKPIIFVILSLLPSLMLAQKWKPVDAEFDSLTLLCEGHRNYIYPLKIYDNYLERMYQISDSIGSKPLLWRTLYWESIFLAKHLNNSKALEVMDKALSLVDSINYKYDYHRIKDMVEFWRSENRYLSKYKLAKKSLAYYTAIKDTLMMAEVNGNIFVALNGMRLLERAMAYEEKRNFYYEVIGYEGVLTKGLITQIYYYLVKNDSLKASQVIDKALKSPLIQTDTVALFKVLSNKYVLSNDSLSLFEAFNLAFKTDLKILQKEILTNMGSYYFFNNNIPEALKYYKQAKDLAETTVSLWDGEDLIPITKGLELSYKKIGYWDSAYYYKDLHDVIIDSILESSRTDEIIQEYQQEFFAQEEQRLKAERQQAKNQLTIILLVFTVILLSLLGVMYLLHTRRQKAEMLHRIKEAENKELETKLENERLEHQLQKERCENQERELTTNSLLLIEKRNMIDNLNKEIEEKGAEGKIDATAKRELLNMIHLHKNTEENLKHFYDYFNQVHPDFFTSLKSSFPTLTKGDLRLCAYIRIGLDSKQIAQILSVQMDAIKQARHRLRRKLSLSPEDSLEDFIMMFNSRT